MACINVLVDSFGGLPQKTIAFPLPSTASVSDLWASLARRLPPLFDARLILTTTSNKQLPGSSPAAISTYLSRSDDAFLPLRLSVPVLGGKGGFGSQLRAAGGRMSSRKRNKQGEQNGSSRNLDGRRLRTVTEAKALAEYLAIKPGMDRQEKERRRQRWDQIVKAADQQEAEVKRRGAISDAWIESKEEASEHTRKAVMDVMNSGATYQDNLMSTSPGSGSAGTNTGSEEEEEDDEDDDVGGSEESTPPSEVPAETKSKEPATSKKTLTFAGFDEDDEFVSSDEE